MTDRVTALFDHRHDAERAVDALREIGVTDDSISLVAQDSYGQTSAGETYFDTGAIKHT